MENEEKIDPAARQLYNAVNWLIIAWRITDFGSAIGNILRQSRDYNKCSDFLIRSLNTIIARDSRNRTLSEMVEELSAKRNVRKESTDFTILKSRIEGMGFKSNF